MGRTKIACIVCLLVLISMIGAAHAQSTTQATLYARAVRSTILSVYSDGSAEVNQTATMARNVTAISLWLLSAQVGNILALDQNRAPLSYQLNGQNITIYTLGAGAISFSYGTDALTTKQGPLWTLSFASPFNITLLLPSRATILSLSGVPVSVSTANSRPMLLLDAASWQISYGLPIALSQPPSSTSSSTSTSSVGSTALGTSSQSAPNSSIQGGAVVPLSTEAVLVAVAVIGVGVAVVVRSKRRGIPGIRMLRFGDAEVLRFIREKGGKAIESEIREHFRLPKTSAWRQAKRLEKLGYVRIVRTGSQNQVELVRQDFEQPMQF
jgi:uncharacterized membrane protein